MEDRDDKRIPGGGWVGWIGALAAGAAGVAFLEWGNRSGAELLQIPRAHLAVLVIAVYGAAVAMAAHAGGMIGGSMATLLASVYAVYAILLPGRPLHGMLESHFPVAMLALAAPALGFVGGILARGAESAPDPPKTQDATTVLLGRDPVSGTLSRGTLHRLAEDEFDAWRVERRPMSLILVDVDHLRAINEAHGEAAGDRVLKALGMLLLRSLRATDHVGRYGADEFALVLTRTSLDGAAIAGQSMIRTVAGMPFPGNGHPIRISVSLAFAAPEPADRCVDDLFSRAYLCLSQRCRSSLTHTQPSGAPETRMNTDA